MGHILRTKSLVQNIFLKKMTVIFILNVWRPYSFREQVVGFHFFLLFRTIFRCFHALSFLKHKYHILISIISSFAHSMLFIFTPFYFFLLFSISFYSLSLLHTKNHSFYDFHSAHSSPLMHSRNQSFSLLSFSFYTHNLSLKRVQP